MALDCFAVRAKDVTKVYRLWNSPQNRLYFALAKLFAFALPPKFKDGAQNYREFYALNNISLEIRKGESWAFIGVNGSGKSTLLKIISGNLRPSSGSVEVDGKVAILDYGSGFNGEFTGKENIYIKATLFGLSRKQINERYLSIIEFAELGDFINQPVKNYSSGMVSRLGFAIMAHVDADIIITDEALAVGDVFFVQKCMRFIRDFLKKGTFLFVSHSIPDVVSLCQNAVWLDKGVIKAIGPVSRVTQAYLDRKDLNLTSEEESQDQHLPQAHMKTDRIIILRGANSDTSSNKLPNEFKDSRLKYRNCTNDNNAIPIPRFEADGSKDIGGANILQVALYNEKGLSISQIIGGELVTLNINVMAIQKLSSPIVSFYLLDRLGQILFSDNSYLMTHEQPFVVNPGDSFMVEFIYQMPLLAAGSYVIRAAVNVVGEKGDFLVLHTVNNALAIHSVTSGPRHGLVGIPLVSIKLRV